MMNLTNPSPTNLRLLLPETLWLEPEHFEQARRISCSLSHEPQQWQTYLNALARFAFEAWLNEHLPDHPIHQPADEAAGVSTFGIGEFKLCLITTEHLLDEVVSIPRVEIGQPEWAAHFYVVLEVLEDQEQVIVRGFLRHDELVIQSSLVSFSQSDEFCRLPLSAFDAELNHLVVYVQYLDPSAIALPTVSPPSIAATLPNDLSPLRTRLSQWLEGVLAEGWQTLEALVNPEANLAWSSRHTSLGTQGGKLINFGMQLGDQAVVLLVTVTPESEEKIGISIQVLPTGGELVLPPELKLTLLSKTESILQEVRSRGHDNYIQLKHFKGKPGTCFSIEVSLNDIRVKEVFEL